GVREGERSRVSLSERYARGGSLRLGAGAFEHVLVVVDRRHPGFGRVVLEVRPRAAADIEHLTAEVAEECAPDLCGVPALTPVDDAVDPGEPALPRPEHAANPRADRERDMPGNARGRAK